MDLHGLTFSKLVLFPQNITIYAPIDRSRLAELKICHFLFNLDFFSCEKIQKTIDEKQFRFLIPKNKWEPKSKFCPPNFVNYEEHF